MLIWFNILIPIAAIMILLFRFKKQMAWWEYVLLFVIPVIAIAIAKFTSVSSQTKDHEIWNSYLTSARYVEYWSTWVDQTCSEEYACGTDSDGNTTYCTRYYDCSYCSENSAYWEAYDNIGRTYRISQTQFEMLCKKWGNRTFVDMRRSIDRSGSCGVDGDAYTTKWNGVFETIVPIANKHSYKNKVQASKSVFKFQDVDSIDIAELGLFEYPSFDRWNYNPILGDNNIYASERLRKHNARLGSLKQVHMLVAVYKNRTLESAMMQENYWQGGNKNEAILCIGLDEKKIDWVHVISWTEEERMKIDIRDSVMNMDYDLVNIVDYFANTVQRQYKRKEFADFDYISIQPTPRAVMITFIITLILTVGLSIFFVLNPFTFDDPANNYSGYRRRY